MAGEKVIELTVDLAGKMSARLDKYLSDHLEDFSRARLQKLIDDSAITVDGMAAKASHKLKGGEKISICVPAERELDLKPEDIPLTILYEDDYLIVVNKPTGLVTHPGAGVQEGTLVNALLYHCHGRLSSISGVVRPGIVHRLDKDTSGVLVVAKQDKAHWSLAEQIKTKQARRMYFALVQGAFKTKEGIANAPIGRDSVHRKRMCVTEKGKPAVSHYQVVSEWPGYSLVKVTLETGRTHQIRVHMASLGHPVVGDIVYGGASASAQRKKFGLPGHALHAAYLSFIHPADGKLLEFEAPLPEAFEKALRLLDRQA